MLYLLTFFGGLAAAVVVLLVAGDWVLLGLVVLFVLVLGFAAKDALPGYMDEIRFMLNLGPVRENERLVFNGVPGSSKTWHSSLPCGIPPFVAA
jgi:hypothetical protein